MSKITEKIDVYHGSSPIITHEIVSELSDHGICLNLDKGFLKIKKKFEYLELLEVPIFIDNGSFERLKDFAKGKIPTNEYFSIEVARQYFRDITREYLQLFKHCTNPSNVIITIPELILSANITQILQKEFLDVYKEIQRTYGCKVIVSLQFDPKSHELRQEIKQASYWIKKNIPTTFRIGIPFGNDFKEIQNGNFGIIEEMFDSFLKNYNAHLFACGTINKIKKFATKPFIASIDASSINVWSRNAHYLSKTTHKIIDIRDIKGKRCSYAKQQEKIEIMRYEGINAHIWINETFGNRFEINLKHFIKIFNSIFFDKDKYESENLDVSEDIMSNIKEVIDELSDYFTPKEICDLIVYAINDLYSSREIEYNPLLQSLKECENKDYFNYAKSIMEI
jgi:hypothetical protein